MTNEDKTNDLSGFRQTPSQAMLSSIPMFSSMSVAQREQIAKSIVWRRAVRGAVIVRSGDPTDSLYVLVSGSARVCNSDKDGKEVILSILEPGDFFGEMGLIDGSPRSADVIASSACDLLVISKPDFLNCMAENFEISFYIIKQLVGRLRSADRKIESLALLDVYGRVARLLLDFSEVQNNVRVVTRKITKQDMAKMIGASREMVSRVMKDLESSGYIRIEDGRIILDEQ